MPCSRFLKSLRVLHGIPIGIKDTFATADIPTGWGTPIHTGQMFGYDAAVVERLRLAGAVIIGKTVTSEYAVARPNKTRNPHNPEHTPGASSSGSAVAVADNMVPKRDQHTNGRFNPASSFILWDFRL